jgi:alpha-galactosidase
VAFEPVAELAMDPVEGRVFEHGWQSWTPTTTYRPDDPPIRPHGDAAALMHAGPGTQPPPDVFQGDGVLAILPALGDPVHVIAGTDPLAATVVRAARLTAERWRITANGPVEHRVDAGPGGIDGALARWADDAAAAVSIPPIRRAPTVWCSWYQYFDRVTEADILENLETIDRLRLPVDVVQIDDGYQADIGDWLVSSPRFPSVPALIRTIRSAGRRAGLWIAPFLVGARSDLAARHPDWLVRGPHGTDGPLVAGRHWGQALHALDTTHPGARAHLQDVVTTFRAWGVDFLKIDFIYAGALPGRRHVDLPPLAAYRDGVALIREALGAGYLLGCGAPIAPSLGLVDAMRISPDTGPDYEPADGDLSAPSSRSAIVTGRARAFQHGRFWVNDPDCLIVRPAVQEREAWAAHVARYGGLRASSDRLADLDEWGLAMTREILGVPPPERFVPSD